MNQSYSNTYEYFRKLGKRLILDKSGGVQVLHHQGTSLRNIAVQLGCSHLIVMYNPVYSTPNRISKRGRTSIYMDVNKLKSIACTAANPISSITIYLSPLFKARQASSWKSLVFRCMCWLCQVELAVFQ